MNPNPLPLVRRLKMFSYRTLSHQFKPLNIRYNSSSSKSIHALQAAFRDPSSPFYLPLGSRGPESPNDPPQSQAYSTTASECANPDPAQEGWNVSEAHILEAQNKLLEQGYDPTSFWEQSIVWGYHDAFQHVNNVHYLRFFESGRLKWLTSFAHALGGPTKARDMISARGVGLILKWIDVRYRRPVRFPDTLLIAHKPSLAYRNTSNDPSAHSRTEFNVAAVAYSFAQRAIVADSNSTLVWYDYDKLKKCNPGDQVWGVLKSRIDKYTKGKGTSL